MKKYEMGLGKGAGHSRLLSPQPGTWNLELLFHIPAFPPSGILTGTA